jgi:hypothetical protein
MPRKALERFPRACLPVAGKAGRLVLLTDYDRSVWKDTGTDFVSLEGETFNVKQFGAKGDGATDDTVAIQAAVTAAAGGMVTFPPGTYVITERISYTTTTTGAAGAHLVGAGMGKTIIDNRVVANSCFYFAGAANRPQIGPSIEGMTILTTTRPATSNGVEVFATLHAVIRDLNIIGLSGDGIRITCATGDPDGPIETLVTNCRVEACLHGLNCNVAAGFTQVSYLTVMHTYFVANTTGCRYIGQAGLFIGNSFVENTGKGMDVVHNGANNQMLAMVTNTFENNGGTPTLDISSMLAGYFALNEFALTATPPGGGTAAVYLSQGGTGVVQDCVFTSTHARIGADFTPYTLWTLGGNATRNKIEYTRWQVYGAAGQTRYSNVGTANNLDSTWQFYDGPTGLIDVMNGAKHELAIPDEGAIFTLSGSTVAFSIGGFTNGRIGREIILYNSTGFDCTFNDEDLGATPANRLQMNNGIALVRNSNGCARFAYFSGNYGPRWHCLGSG